MVLTSPLVSGAGITRRLSIMQAGNVMTSVNADTCRKMCQVLGSVADTAASTCSRRIDLMSDSAFESTRSLELAAPSQ
jgi:hypothetical protein